VNTLAAIFDLDGTLVDTYDAHFKAWTTVCVPYGVDVTVARFKFSFGRTNPPIIRDLWASCGLETPSPTVIEEIAHEKEALFREELAIEFTAMPGASDLLRMLSSAGWLVAIGTSAPQANLDQGIDGLGVRDVVGATTCGDEVAHGKPDPEVFLSCATKLGVAARDCVVIEDAPAGVEAATRGGMASVAIASKGRTRDELAEAGLVINSLTELSPGILAELIERNH
jgi:beta-phosphoglucomutase